jgi:ribonuclease HII
VKALPDRNLWKKHNLVAGIDEAGRGPLAGPVVAAAVILPKYYHHPGIRDSKQLSAKRRVSLYRLITQSALSYAFGIVEPAVIDEINILGATKRAMSHAVAQLSPIPEIILIDALTLADITIPQRALIKGDTLSISIAAASILAKVKRDTIMEKYHSQYPQYHFDQHKGYPTKLHRMCIQRYGPCPIHRKTFRLL